MESANTQSRVVLITGASAGLGRALARRMMKGPYRLVLTARRESLVRFASEGIRDGDNIMVRPLDILNADERVSLIQEVSKRWGQVDVLINNAGFAFRSVLEYVQQEDLLQQMLTNF